MFLPRTLPRTIPYLTLPCVKLCIILYRVPYFKRCIRPYRIPNRSVYHTANAVFQDFETKKAAGVLTLGPFDQRPYFRILLNLLDGMNKPDRQLDNSNLQASLEIGTRSIVGSVRCV